MAHPNADSWILDAHREIAAASPRWHHVFGRFDAGRLGAEVLQGELSRRRALGFTLEHGGGVGVVIGPGGTHSSTLSQLRHGTARAALQGGLGALTRMHQADAAEQRLVHLWTPPGEEVAQRLGPPKRVATLLAARHRPYFLVTDRFEEVRAYEAAGMTLWGQEGVAQSYTIWLLSSLPTRRA